MPALRKRRSRALLVLLVLAALGLPSLFFVRRTSSSRAAKTRADAATAPARIVHRDIPDIRPIPEVRPLSGKHARVASARPALAQSTAAATDADSEPEVDEFHTALDAAIQALERLREVDVRLPEVRTKAMSALGATLHSLDLKSFRGQDPWTEALLRAVKAGLEHEDVRDKWTEVLQSLVAPRREARRDDNARR
jgi:hypothetical protein